MPQLYEEPNYPNDPHVKEEEEEFDGSIYWEELDRFESMCDPKIL